MTRYKKAICVVLTLTMLLATIAVITTFNVNAESATSADMPFILFNANNQQENFGNAPEQLIYDGKGGVTLKSPKRVSQQHQMGWDYDLDTITAALKAANGADGKNLLQITTDVISAKHGTTKKNCSVEIQIMIHTKDSLDTVSVQGYVDVGKSKTFFLDVTDLKPEMVSLVRLNVMNYANVDPDTGNACGVTDIEVKFTPLTVSGVAAPKTTIVTLPINYNEAQAIADLYVQIPGTTEEDFHTVAQYQALADFTEKYTNASIGTQNYLDTAYGITQDNYGELMSLYDSMAPITTNEQNYTTKAAVKATKKSTINDTEENNNAVGTGQSALPFTIFTLAVAAGFVVFKSRKK